MYTIHTHAADVKFCRPNARRQPRRRHAAAEDSKAVRAADGCTPLLGRAVVLFAPDPVIRTPLEIHDGEDSYALGLDGVEESVGEPSKQTPPDLALQDWSGFWVL
jgi:hypothetical protein